MVTASASDPEGTGIDFQKSESNIEPKKILKIYLCDNLYSYIKKPPEFI